MIKLAFPLLIPAITSKRLETGNLLRTIQA